VANSGGFSGVPESDGGSGSNKLAVFEGAAPMNSLWWTPVSSRAGWREGERRRCMRRRGRYKTARDKETHTFWFPSNGEKI